MISLILTTLSGCATRQLTDTLEGATAQRLVTYSLEGFVTEILKQSQLELLSNTTVQLRVHFLQDHPMMNYATRLLTQQLKQTLGIEVSASEGNHGGYIDIYLNSLGTDQDSYGLSLPTFGLASTPDARINLLAIDMFHGVTEGYAVVETADGQTYKTERVLARVRADNVATPVIDFPLNQLD